MISTMGYLLAFPDARPSKSSSLASRSWYSVLSFRKSGKNSAILMSPALKELAISSDFSSAADAASVICCRNRLMLSDRLTG